MGQVTLPARLSPTEDLILEVLTARHLIGEPWWDFRSTHKATLRRLVDRGLVEVVNDTRASLTAAGRTEYLPPHWTPAYQRAVQDIAEEITDASGRRWWWQEARRHDIPGEVALEIGKAAAALLREWSRLLPEDSAARYRALMNRTPETA